MRPKIFFNGFTRLAALMLAAGLGLGCTTVQSKPAIEQNAAPHYFGPAETNAVMGDSPGFAPVHSAQVEAAQLDIRPAQQRWVF
jgi:hypothetical protein